MKKRKLRNANSNSTTKLVNIDDEALKRNRKKWVKHSTVLTYPILETSSEIPLVSRYNNND